MTAINKCNTFSAWQTFFPKDKQIAVISMLAEGSKIRSVGRITGVNRNTIMNLGVRVGHGCAKILDVKMRNLTCHFLQFDEIWGFIGKKEKHCLPTDDLTPGDVWTSAPSTRKQNSFNVHGVVADHVKTIPVHEEFQGQTVWEGEVEVFDFTYHPKANVHTLGDTQRMMMIGAMSSYWNCRPSLR